MMGPLRLHLEQIGVSSSLRAADFDSTVAFALVFVVEELG